MRSPYFKMVFYDLFLYAISLQDMVYKQCVGFLKTPPLWRNEQFGIHQFEFPYLELKDFKRVIVSHKMRLGHQMEAVFNQLVDRTSRYEILLHNLAIREGKKTLGEIDFILNDLKTLKIIHVELTYKFYIIDTSISEPIHRLMEPSRRDMFFTKMEKIKNQQFPLLHSVEGSKALLDKGVNHKNIEHQCCFKAQLFIPYGISKVHIRPLNKACIAGFWLRFDNFNTLEFKSYQYYIPYKSEWVVDPHKDIAWQSHYEIIININMHMLKENSPMVWMRKSETEFEKFFVVWF